MNALLQGKPSVDLPKDSKSAWVSTRRGKPAADQIAGHLHSSYLLHDMMRSLTAPLDELFTAHAVVLEAPSIVAQRFEHNMLNLIGRVIPQCPHRAVIVQPSLRRKSNKTLWMSRWNRSSFVRRARARWGTQRQVATWPCLLEPRWTLI